MHIKPVCAYLKGLCALLLVIIVSGTARAQTSLSYGDVLVVGFNNNMTTAGDRDFQWVPLVNLLPGTVIKFNNASFATTATANTANNAMNFGGTTIWTNTAGFTIGAGTVITIHNGTATTASLGSCSALPSSCSCGSSSGAFMPQSTSGGKIFIYDGGTSAASTTDFTVSTNPSTFNGTPVSYMTFQGTQTGYTTLLSSGTASSFKTYLPADLASYSLFLAGNAIGGYYNGPRLNGSVAAISAAILDPANWVTVSGAGSIVTYPTGNFSFGSGLSFGAAATFSVYGNSTANPLGSQLAFVDTTISSADSITVINAPGHGSLGGFPYTVTSTGGIYNTF